MIRVVADTPTWMQDQDDVDEAGPLMVSIVCASAKLRCHQADITQEQMDAMFQRLHVMQTPALHSRAGTPGAFAGRLTSANFGPREGDCTFTAVTVLRNPDEDTVTVPEPVLVFALRHGSGVMLTVEPIPGTSHISVVVQDVGSNHASHVLAGFPLVVRNAVAAFLRVLMVAESFPSLNAPSAPAHTHAHEAFQRQWPLVWETDQTRRRLHREIQIAANFV